MAEFPPPPEGIVLAHFIVSDDVERSRRFYTEVLGGRVAYSGPGGLTYVALSNSWIIINAGGGPTDDKPTVILETPRDLNRVSSFLNIRVKDIDAVCVIQNLLFGRISGTVQHIRDFATRHLW